MKKIYDSPYLLAQEYAAEDMFTVSVTAIPGTDIGDQHDEAGEGNFGGFNGWGW